MDNAIVVSGGVKTDAQAKALDAPNYQMLFWLFMVGSVIGFVLEGLWSIVKLGHWEHHASTIWGPFCGIYGLGAVGAYLLARRLWDKRLPVQFIACALSGGAVEYAGSLFQELVLGSVSWDYSDHFMNINGRVSLQMAILGGALGIAFMHLAFPLINRAFQKVGGRKGALICGVATAFMVVNLAATSAVVIRWQARTQGVPPANAVEQAIDAAYGDETMAYLYQNMRFVD